MRNSRTNGSMCLPCFGLRLALQSEQPACAAAGGGFAAAARSEARGCPLARLVDEGEAMAMAMAMGRGWVAGL